jgi:membrane-bound lytic murein transglycosylase D
VVPAPADQPAVGVTELEAAALLESARDSAADAAALAALDEARPDSNAGNDGAHGGASALGEALTWDIDVETYASHERVQYYLDFFQGKGRERMAIWLTRMPRYESMIREQLRLEDVPGDMVYLALIESGFSNSAVSRARATGMWQFMKGTGRMYGLRIDQWVDERRDPVRATSAAARHLDDLRDRFGSIYLAAAAYNAGAGKVSRGLRGLPDDPVEVVDVVDVADLAETGEAEEEAINNDADFFRLYDTRFLRRETKDYVPKLIAAALIAKDPERYGFAPIPDVSPFAYDSIIVPDQTGLDVIARLAGAPLSDLRDLNPHYIRLVTPPHTRAVVRVPVGSGEATRLAYAELPPSKRVAYRTHSVRSGETLGGIAKRYGVSTRYLRDANPKIPKSGMIRVGQRIVIPTEGYSAATRAAIAATEDVSRAPSRRSSVHVVRSGETVGTIARRYGMTQAELKRLNSLKSDRILVGQKLKVRKGGRTA